MTALNWVGHTHVWIETTTWSTSQGQPLAHTMIRRRRCYCGACQRPVGDTWVDCSPWADAEPDETDGTAGDER